MAAAEIGVTSLVKFYTLLLLLDAPRSGYDLMKEIGARLGKKVGPSQVYPFLAKLEAQGLVAKKSGGARRKKRYALTPAGARFVRRQLARFGALIDIAVRPRLKTCAHCGCKVLEGGHREKQGRRALTFCCRHCARAFQRHA